MIPKKHTIADNIRLSYIQTDKFKEEALTVSLDMPLTPENYVLSHVLCLALGRGCERLPSLAQINRELDELYASTVGFNTNTRGDNLSVCIYADMISNRFVTDGTDVLRGVLRTAADMLLRPLIRDGAFLPDTVEKVKISFLDLVRSIKNHPKLYAAARLGELMDRNLDRKITLEDIIDTTQKVDAKALYEFYKELITCSSLNVFYVGAQPPETVANAVADAFSGFVGISGSAPIMPSIEKPAEYVSVTENMPLKQGTLAMGFRTGAGLSEGTHTALIILNEIFGGSAASKLFLNVRERMSLCYYCGSKVSTLSGNVTVCSGLDNANRDIAAEEILRQLSLIARGEISEQEMTAARQSIEYSYSQIYDAPRSLQSFYLERELFGITETVEEHKQKLLAVSAEDVCRLAQNTVHDTQFYICGTSAESEDEYDE